MECGLTRVANFSMKGSRPSLVNFRGTPRIPHFEEVNNGRGNGGGMHLASPIDASGLFLMRWSKISSSSSAYLLDRMKSVQWGTRQIFYYNSVVFCAPGLNDEAEITPDDNVQVLLAGNAGGQLETGRSVRVNSSTRPTSACSRPSSSS